MRDEFLKNRFDMSQMGFWSEVLGIMQALDKIFDLTFWETLKFASKEQF